jgi:hypothetical protein
LNIVVAAFEIRTEFLLKIITICLLSSLIFMLLSVVLDFYAIICSTARESLRNR